MTKLSRIFIPIALLAACLMVSCENDKSKQVTKERTERTIERDTDDR